MRNILVLAVTGALLAAQFHWGLRRKKLLGAVLPAVFALLFGRRAGSVPGGMRRSSWTACGPGSFPDQAAEPS